MDASVIDLERAERDAAIPQAKQIAAHLFFGQPIRRTAIVGGQPTDRVDVDGLGSRRTPPTSCLQSSAIATASSRSPLVRASQRDGAGPSKDILNSDDSVASARPYGEAVQSNVLYGTL